MKKAQHFVSLTGVIPEIIDEQDKCIKALTNLIKTNAGCVEAHIDEHQGAKGICIHYDPTQINLNQLEAKITLAGAIVVKRYQHAKLTINGMDCIECTKIIEHALSHLPGILIVKINP